MSNGIVIKIGGGGGAGVDDTARAAIAALQNQKGQPSGIATLDSDGKVPVSQLPDGLDGVDEEARQAIANLANQKGEPEGIATLDSSGKVPLEQLPEDIGSGSGVDDFARQEIANLQNVLNDKVDNSRVLKDVPANAVFTDTITTINGKTGVITKEDIMALGIPGQDTITTVNGKTGAITKADIVALGIPAQDTVTTVNGKTGAISKEDILALGISDGGVDIEARQAISDLQNLIGEPEGIAALDEDGKVPLEQLPEDIGSGGVDAEARASIAQLESQYNDIANQVNSAPKFVRVDEYPVDPEEGVVYFRVVLPEDPEDPEEPEDPNIVRYYTEGVENVEWVESYSAGDDTYATQSKEVDHLYLELFDKIGVAANRTYATKDPVDLTDINTIEIDYESIDAVSNFTMRFGVSLERDKGNNSSFYVAHKDAGGVDPRTVLSIDVSALTGDHYIRVAIMNTSSTESRYGKLKVYNVRGVKNA